MFSRTRINDFNAVSIFPLYNTCKTYLFSAEQQRGCACAARRSLWSANNDTADEQGDVSNSNTSSKHRVLYSQDWVCVSAEACVCADVRVAIGGLGRQEGRRIASAAELQWPA